jgi:hypothetical protein
VGTFEADSAAVLATAATATNWADASDSLWVSTTSVVNLDIFFGTVPEVGSPDVRDRGVIGSEGELASV